MTIAEIRRAIEEAGKRDLPGDRAHRLMKPDRADSLQAIPENEIRHSAVLIWLVASGPQEQGSVIMIERAEGGVHSGQIAFPGGKYEEADGDFWQTALRETSEELGSETSSLDQILSLSPLFIPPSRFWVHPFVAVSEFLPPLRPNESEVRQVLMPRLHSFLDQQHQHFDYFISSKGARVKAPYYSLNEHKVWGASAMILSELLKIIRP